MIFLLKRKLLNAMATSSNAPISQKAEILNLFGQYMVDDIQNDEERKDSAFEFLHFFQSP